jgi:hypothetical protein
MNWQHGQGRQDSFLGISEEGSIGLLTASWSGMMIGGLGLARVLVFLELRVP